LILLPKCHVIIVAKYLNLVNKHMATQGSPLSPEFKRAVVLLKGYFDRTQNDLSEQGCSSVERTAHALEVGAATVKRVMADYNRDPALLEEAVSLCRGHRPRTLSDSLQTITRDYVRQANREGKHLTLEMLADALKEEGGAPDFSVRTLGRALDRWGFTFGKGTRSHHLKEKDHVVAARQRYLRAKRANRRGAEVIRPEVYLDESYVNKNHSNDFIWYCDEDGPWVQKPSGKGERLIIVHAMTRHGWLPGAKLTFKSSRKTGDYHGQMNQELFTRWFTEQLLANIPESSLIILDNASYHNALSAHSAPTATCKKARIGAWLQKNGIPVRDDCLKAELVEILAKLAPPPTYALDELTNAQGHDILRTPPYHPELQPIETCWAVVKNQIARRNNFTMADLVAQLDEAFERVTEETCSGLIKKVRQVEDKYWREDMQLDRRE
jgi:transposase